MITHLWKMSIPLSMLWIKIIGVIGGVVMEVIIIIALIINCPLFMIYHPA